MVFGGRRKHDPSTLAEVWLPVAQALSAAQLAREARGHHAAYPNHALAKLGRRTADAVDISKHFDMPIDLRDPVNKLARTDLYSPAGVAGAVDSIKDALESVPSLVIEPTGPTIK